MPATVPTIDTPANIYRGTSNIALPADVSREIWGAVLEESAFMRLARQIAIPGTGTTIQTITGEPAADWVSETAAKPVSAHTFNKKVLAPYKLAVIEPFSMEFIRDKAALYEECVRRLPAAIAAKFDSTIMGTTAPGTGFDVLGSATAVSLNPSLARCPRFSALKPSSTSTSTRLARLVRLVLLPSSASLVTSLMLSMASLRASRLTFPVTLRSSPLAALSPCSSRTWLLSVLSVRLRSVSRARPSSTSSLAMCRLLNHGEANRT